MIIYRGEYYDIETDLANENIQLLHRIDIIDTASDIATLKALECYHIKKLNTLEEGYNLTSGGDGCVGYKHTPEHREYMRNIMVGKNKGKQPECYCGNNGQCDTSINILYQVNRTGWGGRIPPTRSSFIGSPTGGFVGA